MSIRETCSPTTPSPKTGCWRHRWCVRETTMKADDGGLARFHLGVPTVVEGGDDSVTVVLLATEDDDTVYVELEVANLDHNPVTVWLTSHEVQELADVLQRRQAM